MVKEHREQNIRLEDIDASDSNVPDNPDDKTDIEYKDFLNKRLEILNKGLRQDIGERLKYSGKIYILIVFWLIGIFIIILLQGFGSKYEFFSLDNKVLLTVICGTTINIIAIFLIVVNYLFKNTKK
ncbi:MAG: hypothetical protein HQ591_01105 [candidate division Zixibacteria bacterium]|nr:hypothetical protein [Candidatus Tariuqbacter arcticus]